MSVTSAPTQAPGPRSRMRTGWGRGWLRPRSAASLLSPRAAVSAVVSTAAGRLGLACGAVVMVVIAAGSLRGVAPSAVAIGDAFRGPSWAHPLGTDNYGRDELSRLAAGGRTSLLAAVLVLAIAMVLALLVGTLSGLLGGAVDAVLMRLVDVVLSIPPLVLAMAVIGALGPGFMQLVAALSVSYIASFTRMSRAFALSSRNRADLAAARLAGVGWWRSTVGHVLPGVASQLCVISTLTLGDIVINIAGLSFLGLGIQPPAPEWGSMLSDSRSAFSAQPWLLIGPAAAIVLTAAAVNLIADAVRERVPS